MKRDAIFLIATVIAAGVIAIFTMSGYANADSWSYDSDGIHLDNGDVVIRGDNGTTARITPDGALLIAGESQKVTAAQRDRLRHYVATVEDMRAKALALAGAAGQFAGRVVSDVLAGLFSGASEAQIDRAAHAHARDFKQQALPICEDAQTLKHLQDFLTASLPAFRPYAIIAGHDVEECQRKLDD